MLNLDESNNLFDTQNSIRDDEEQVQVKFFTKERSIKMCVLKNLKYSIPIRLLHFLIKVLPSILYIIQVIYDDPSTVEGCCHICVNHSVEKHDPGEVDITKVHWERLLFVNRRFGLWIAQIVCSNVSLCHLVMIACISQKGSMMSISFLFSVLVELLNSIPFYISIFYSRCLFIPTFLNCWLAKRQFEDVVGDIFGIFKGSQPPLFHRIMKVISSSFCIIFTSVCGFQHLQRAGYRHISLFESLWFVVVTFSTVGYGDYKPDMWLSQAFTIFMILTALIVIPIELERLVQAWMEGNKLGGTYSLYRSKREKHVVICTMCLNSNLIIGFLNEFYAHPTLQNYCVCILSPDEMDSSLKVILKMSNWNHRVIYIQGTAFKDADLARCKLQNADACFILAPKTYEDSNTADQDTIMLSWSIKDYAPQCSLYVELYRPENKMHLKFAEHVVCLNEFKYALLGNNTLIPGVSTLVTLLIHTSKGQEGQESQEIWQKTYGKCSGNEVYNITLGQSKFFKEFLNKSFSYASYKAYKRYGVNLVAIKSEHSSHIVLNPGPNHIMCHSDVCFYISITEEQNSSVHASNKKPHNWNEVKINGKAYKTDYVDEAAEQCESPMPRNHKFFHRETRERSVDNENKKSKLNYMVNHPPILPYIDSGFSLCHLLTEKQQPCCLHLLKPCTHRPNKRIIDYYWQCPSVMVCMDTVNLDIYNFIVPLRNHWLSENLLKPIIFLVNDDPKPFFFDILTSFPLVYWMLGSYESIDDLLKAGIQLADNVIVVNKDLTAKGETDFTNCKEKKLKQSPDAKTILAVQQIFKLFPRVRISTAIRDSSNMKFIQFLPGDMYASHINKLEKKEKCRGSQISFLFRLPFAAGNVFSINMLDNILYQAFVKPYLIQFLRQFLGIYQVPGSGHLNCIRAKDFEGIDNYGSLYEILSNTYNEIPIGIYRTIDRVERNTDTRQDNSELQVFKDRKTARPQDQQISEIVKNKILSLNIPLMHFEKTSFVLINPGYGERLEVDDIIYLISSPSQSNSSTLGQTNFQNNFATNDLENHPIFTNYSSTTMYNNDYTSIPSSSEQRLYSPETSHRNYGNQDSYDNENVALIGDFRPGINESSI